MKAQQNTTKIKKYSPKRGAEEKSDINLDNELLLLNTISTVFQSAVI